MDFVDRIGTVAAGADQRRTGYGLLQFARGRFALGSGADPGVGRHGSQTGRWLRDRPHVCRTGFALVAGWLCAIVLPLRTPEKIQTKVETALAHIVEGKTRVADTTFPEFMEQSGFDHTFRSGAELREFLEETDRKFGKLLTSDAMRSVNRDPFPPMAFPWLLIGLLGVTLLTGLVSTRRELPRAVAPSSATDAASVSTSAQGGGSYLGFGLVVGSILFYIVAAEAAGFILVSFVILMVLTRWMGAGWRGSLGLSLIFPLVIFQIFAHVLRVPLPQGWLGW